MKETKEDFHILAAVEKKIVESFLRLQEAHHLINAYKRRRGYEIKELKDLLPADPDVTAATTQIESECVE